MAINTGLSNITAKFQDGNTKPYARSDGGHPEEQYAKWKNDGAGMAFQRFPPDYAQQRIILVGREYTLGVTGAVFGNGNARTGYILPLPQMRLTDNYQVNFDSDFSYLNLLVARGSTIEQTGRVAGFNLNRFRTVLMEAPMLKRHEFIWKLSPKNFQESAIINNILLGLKHDMAPGSSTMLGSVVLTYPYIFDIYYDPNWKEMYGFKPSVIESLSVDYAGGNPHPANYTSGYPESVTITMNLIEIEIWIKQDYVAWARAQNPVGTLRGFPNPGGTLRDALTSAANNFSNFGTGSSVVPKPRVDDLG